MPSIVSIMKGFFQAVKNGLRNPHGICHNIRLWGQQKGQHRAWCWLSPPRLQKGCARQRRSRTPDIVWNMPCGFCRKGYYLFFPFPPIAVPEVVCCGFGAMAAYESVKTDLRAICQGIGISFGILSNVNIVQSDYFLQIDIIYTYHVDKNAVY